MIPKKPSRGLFSRTRNRPAGFLLERLGCDQLERRVVLDGDSLAPPAETLIVDSPFTMPTPSAMAQFGDFTYEIVGAAVTITKYSGNAAILDIPAEIAGLPVTSIGSLAFFGCSGLTSVTIPSSVTSIGLLAFDGCTGLTGFEVAPANSVFSTLEGVLFNKSGSILVAFPSGRGGEYEVPASVLSIGRGAFSGCTSLADFDVALANPSFSAFQGVLFNKSRSVLMAFPGAKGGHYSVPIGVASIGPDAFHETPRLKSITIPESLTSIDRLNFRLSSTLTAVYFLGGPPTPVGNMAWVDSSRFDVYHRPDVAGWSSRFFIHQTATFQPFDIPAGETSTTTIPAGVSRLLKQGPGTLIVEAASPLPNGFVVTEGTLLFHDRIPLHGSALEIQDGARVVVEASFESIDMPTLSLAATATLDIGTNRLTIGLGEITESGLRQAIIRGRNGGSSGVLSSNASIGREVGYRVTDGKIEVVLAAPGDTNLDGVVNVYDLININTGGQYGKASDAGWSAGDFNYDGRANVFDLVSVSSANVYGKPAYRTEFRSLFDGNTLSGWTGDTNYWSVVDGAIVGQSSAENLSAANTFLRWDGGEVRDFELKVEYRIDSGNSGIQFRSSSLTDFRVAGYQADIDAAVAVTGNVYDQLGRRRLALRGESVSISENGTKTVTGSLGTSSELAAAIRTNDWNEYRIVARGTEIEQYINGVLMSRVTDNHVGSNRLSGILALQLHAGTPMKVAFRSVRLRTL